MRVTTACLFASALIIQSVVAAAQAQTPGLSVSFLSRRFVCACVCETRRSCDGETLR
jgi:hypothetical protein